MSFLIEPIDKDAVRLILTNDILLLQVTSKYWKNLINYHIGKKYNNRIVKITNKIRYASGNGDVNVLEWFKNSDYEFEYCKYAINYASGNGHINVLEWFKNSDYEFKYDEEAINYASENGHIHVLEWFKKNGYMIQNKYINI